MPATTRSRCAICWDWNKQQILTVEVAQMSIWKVAMHAMGTIPNISAAFLSQLRLNAVYLTTYKNGDRDRTIHIISVIKFLFCIRETVKY
jgi:hypothetical protein